MSLKKIKFFIVTYWSIKDKGTFVGGLRPYKLFEFLKSQNINAQIVAPAKFEGSELLIKEGVIFKLFRPILRILPPDFSIVWSFKVFLKLFQNARKNKIILFTTIPPNGIGVSGLLLKLFSKNVYWIVDFRDLWTKHPLYSPPITKRYIDPLIEKMYMRYSDLVILNTEWDLYYNQKLHPIILDKSIFVRNGFDRVHTNKYQAKSTIEFIYTGGTTYGQATIFINKILSKLNDAGIKSICYFYGEYDSLMDNSKYIEYKGIVTPKEIPELLTQYKFGFIYFPRGSETGGRVAQKFYDYIGSGVIPVCIRPSKETMNLMEILDTGIKIHNDFNLNHLIQSLNEAKSPNDEELINELTRANQFNKLINTVDKNLCSF